MTGKRRFNYSLLQNICNANGVTLLEDYSTIYLTRDSRIIGKCVLCENSFNKSFDKIDKQLNFGCETCSKILKFQRIKKTMLNNYGVEYAAQLTEFKDKMKSTSLEKYGVEHALQNEEIKQKIKQTNREKYGCDYGFQNEEVKEKRRITNLTKYGVEYCTQREDVKIKTKQTSLEKYGVEHASQHPDILDKMTKNMYKSKEYYLPSGNIIQIQGYEHFALDELLNNNIEENDVITGCKNVPTIWYEDETGKKHRHYVDIFIPSQNRCIEVKSTWTAKLNKHNIYLKQIAAKKLGYEYEIWVYNNKAEKVGMYT
jgi:hypothetical protein